MAKPTVADFFWSDWLVISTDIVLLVGCAASLYLSRPSTSVPYFWAPIFFAYWISSLPSFFATGGLNSPFFGVGLATMFMIGVVMDSKSRAKSYALFAAAHIPAFLIIEFFYPISQISNLPIAFTSIITSSILAALFICVYALLRTEDELAHEFAEHFRHLAQTESDLKQRQSQLREAQSVAKFGSWEWDVEADRITWSDELFNIFEISKESFDPSYKAYLDRLNPQVREHIHTTIQHSMATGSDFFFENRVQTSKGERHVVSYGRVSRNANGVPTKMHGTSQDITDRKRIESELVAVRADLERRVQERTLQLAESLMREKAAKEIAENASQAKMQFLANMSHEIRTPMNAILGFSDLLYNSMSDSNDPKGAIDVTESKDYLSRIRTNGQQLLHLIDDILDLSKFEAGGIPIQKSVFSMRTLVDGIAKSFSPAVDAKGLKLEISFDPDVPAKVISDSFRVSQVLTNLAGNAIKFSSTGTVAIRVKSETTKGSEGNRQLHFEIEDSGVGISLENQKRLFQPFSQGDSSVARKYGGSGLGLALSRGIAAAMGGSLTLVSSTPGVGSRFRFQIPIDQAPVDFVFESQLNERSGNKSPLPLNGKRVLLAEDSPDNALLICHYLKSVGMIVDIVSDGIAAVKSIENNSYDCILMDIQMPGMDGLEATRRIRAKSFHRPVIALTAHALSAEAERSLEAGCDRHLTKPISKTVLIEALTALLYEQAINRNPHVET